MADGVDFGVPADIRARLDGALGPSAFTLLREDGDLEVVIGVRTHEEPPRCIRYALWPTAQADDVRAAWDMVVGVVERSKHLPVPELTRSRGELEALRNRLGLIESVASDSLAKAHAFGGEVRLARRIVAICQGKL